MSTQTSTNPIHKALHSLLPPSSTLPPRLISAAESLLAVSRQRASHLKPDEEIARPHVCAELACRRLRATLRLPNIKSGNGAPCRPPVYRKLLASLEQTLGDVELLGTPKGRKHARSASQTPTAGRSTGKSTGRKRNIEALSLDEDDDVPVETPTKKRRTSDMIATPTKSNGKKTPNKFVGKILAANTSSTNTEEYVPLIRKLCTAFKTSKMVPHVYTGVCVIGDLGREDTEVQEDSDTKRFRHLSLIIAIYLLTLTKMQEGMMTTDVYDGVLQRSIQLLQVEQAHHADTTKQIEDWIARVNDEEWTALPGKGSDWWSSVPEDNVAPLDMSTILNLSDDNTFTVDLEATPKARRNVEQTRKARQLSRREELRKQLEEEDPEDVLLPGLGTMMNDELDYFSEERTADYEAWKADMLKELEARGL